MDQENGQLKKLLGEKELEIAILRDLVKKPTLTCRKGSHCAPKEWIMGALAGDGYAYGYRKLTHYLRQEYELVINEKNVYRLCKELDVL